MELSENIRKGKPSESRGRKANGSTVTKVTMIARPPKIKIEHYYLYAASLGSPARCFLSRHYFLIVR